jgi:hypothetical protein
LLTPMARTSPRSTMRCSAKSAERTSTHACTLSQKRTSISFQVASSGGSTVGPLLPDTGPARSQS